MTRLTVDFDRIFSCSPANATAAAVTSGAGPRSAPSPSRTTLTHWEAPPTTVRVPAGVRDLSGRTLGRLKVKGLLSSERRTWLVRCACGDYEPRTARQILGADPEDRCSVCSRASEIRHMARVSSYGERLAATMRADERKDSAAPVVVQGLRLPAPDEIRQVRMRGRNRATARAAAART